MPARVAAADADVSPGTISNGTRAAASERERLLGPPGENERIASAEPDDPKTTPHAGNHAVGDGQWIGTVLAAAARDRHPFGSGRKVDDCQGDETVVQHQVSLLEARRRATREQFGVSRPRTHDRHHGARVRRRMAEIAGHTATF
jgi:hypothetical protein